MVRKAEHEVKLSIASLKSDAQTFAVAKQIVGRVFESKEAAGISRDTPVELYLLAALFLDLQVDFDLPAFFRWSA
jgi:hypothetical protein